MVSFFLLSLSFTTIFLMDIEPVEDVSTDVLQIIENFLKEFPSIVEGNDQEASDSENQSSINEFSYTDVDEDDKHIGRSHEGDIDKDKKRKPFIKQLNEKLLQLEETDREKIKKQIGKKIYQTILEQTKQQAKLDLEKNYKSRLADVVWRVNRNEGLTEYQESKQDIENEYKLKIRALEGVNIEFFKDFQNSQTDLDRKFQQNLEDLFKFVNKKLCSLFGNKPEMVVDMKNLKKEIQEEIKEEIFELQSVMNVKADQQQIQQITNELKEYIEKTSKQPYNVIGIIVNNLYSPFINYAKEVDYYGKKSDKVLKVHCSELLGDEETTKKCRKIRAAMFWMSYDKIVKLLFT